MRDPTGRGGVVAVLGVVAGLVAGLVAGCGSLQGTEVQRTATDFAGADPAGRCQLLAPATVAALVAEESSSCEEAIEQLPLGTGQVVSVEVWGEEAQVRLADDTLFLTRTSDGWRIEAGACDPSGGEGPYECQLEGS